MFNIEKHQSTEGFIKKAWYNKAVTQRHLSQRRNAMEHQVKTFDLKGLKGLSDQQMAPHRDVLYTGYVKKLNEIEKQQRAADLTKANGTYAEFRELKVEEPF